MKLFTHVHYRFRQHLERNQPFQFPEPSEERIYKTSPASQSAAIRDPELVTRFIAGDESAFEEIVQLYCDRLFHIASRFLRNSEDAEEVAQDALIRAHRALHNFRGDSSLATWLNHVTTNLARNRYWYLKRRAEGRKLSLDAKLSDGSQEDFSVFFADCSATAPVEISRREFNALVVACAEKLPPPQKEIFDLSNGGQLSYSEIGERLQCAEGIVKSRLARARRSLARLMSEQCPDFGQNALPSEWLERSREFTPLAN